MTKKKKIWLVNGICGTVSSANLQTLGGQATFCSQLHETVLSTWVLQHTPSYLEPAYPTGTIIERLQATTHVLYAAPRTEQSIAAGSASANILKSLLSPGCSWTLSKKTPQTRTTPHHQGARCRELQETTPLTKNTHHHAATFSLVFSGCIFYCASVEVDKFWI